VIGTPASRICIGIIDGGVVGAGIVIGGGVGVGAGGVGSGGGAGGGGCGGSGFGTYGAVGLGDGAVGVSDEVGAGVSVGAGPVGCIEIGGTHSSGGAGVLGSGDGGRDGSAGPLTVDWPSGGPIVPSSRWCEVEHATPNALAVISEPTITPILDRRIMVPTKGCEAHAARTERRRHTTRGGTRIATEPGMPARAIDTATIAFGLVSIPIKIYSTSEPSHEIHFHLIHEGCGERLEQRYVCAKHGEVERSEMTKGFELTKGSFVELSKDELETLEAVASDEVAIREFVPESSVDPILVERTYYLAPGKGGERAYRLLRDALENSELVGIAAYSARGKQYVVMVRPFEDGLAMHQLRYPDEIKEWSEVPVGKLPKASPAELGLASQIIDQLRHETFDPTQYTDEVKGRVRKLIATKAKGGEIVAPPEAPKPVVTDLMEALKASLTGETNGHINRASHAKRAGTGPGTRGHARERSGPDSRPHGSRAGARAHAKRGTQVMS